MTTKTFIRIAVWAVIYIAALGFILPALFSAKSTIAVAIGCTITLLLLYHAATCIRWDKIANFIKEIFN